MPFIPLEVYANNPSTTVSAGGTTNVGGVSGTAETWTVASSASFPAVEIGATQFHVADPALPNEVITVQNVTGTTWAVIRGAEGSIPLAHTAGFTVVQVITAGVMAQAQYPSWQFPVQAYNAQGDGKIGTGGTGASGQAVLTDAGASFVNATAPAGDVGKVIIVNQGTGSATVATNPFVGTISSVNSATSITLSANLAATCTAAPYVYGTDDSAAITSAITAAAQWAVATGNYKVQVMFEPQLYMLGALTQSTTKQWSPYNTGLNYTYNTQVAIPFTTQYARKLVIDLVGTGDASAPDFWGGTVPSIQGTCLVSAVWAAAEPNGTYGQMSVIGTPSAQTNIGTGGISAYTGFANVLVNIDGITVVTPFNSMQYSFDFRYAAQLKADASAAVAFAPVNYSAQAVGGPWLRASNIPANGVAIGLAMPLVGNNALALVGRFSCEGLSTGFLINEHFTAQHIVTMYCDTSIRVQWLPAGSIIHGGSIGTWTCEGSNMGIYTNNAATCQYNLFIADAEFEVMNTGYVNDPNGNLNGAMYFHDLSQWSPVGAATVASNFKIINTRMPIGIWAVNAALSIPAPPAAPASNTAQQNTCYRDATVYASAVTSITSFTVAPTSAGLATSAVITVTAGANAGVPIRVPSGFWYKLTYSGTLTTTWVVD